MRDQKSFDKSSQSKGLQVTAIAAEMQRIVLRAAEPVKPGDTVKGQMRRSWEALKRPPFWRLRAAWYGEAGCWSAVAVEDMRRRDAERRRKEEAGRAQASELATLYAGIAARLGQIDPDFHSDSIIGLKQAARALGALDRAVAETD